MEFGAFSGRIASKQDWGLTACRGEIEREGYWEDSQDEYQF